MSELKVGVQVKIVGYGELTTGNGGCPTCGHSDSQTDVMPHIVGKKGVINQVVQENGFVRYGLSGIPEKARWYFSDQLRII